MEANSTKNGTRHVVNDAPLVTPNVAPPNGALLVTLNVAPRDVAANVPRNVANISRNVAANVLVMSLRAVALLLMLPIRMR